MDRNANRIANKRSNSNPDVRGRDSGGHIRRGLRREARAASKRARKVDARWAREAS